MPDFENLDDFFELEEFAQPVLKGPPGSEVEIHPIFDNATVLVDDAQAPVNIPQPMITCKTADVLDVEEGTRFVVGGIAYTALEPDHDGTGISTIRLFRA